MQEKKRLLSFVIVGGGPTGVEVAAEVYDMIVEDMKHLYPRLISFVKIQVVELMDYILSTYDRKIGEYTSQLFKRNGVELVRFLNRFLTAFFGGLTEIDPKGRALRFQNFAGFAKLCA
jgi:NADH dehydrogenase FAD-containing subunit